MEENIQNFKTMKAGALLLSVIITLAILCIMPFSCKEKKEYDYWDFRAGLDSIRHNIDSAHRVRQDSIRAANESICAERGHLYERVENGAFDETDDYNFSEGDRDEIVDEPDSSYIIRQPAPINKHCYRCSYDTSIYPPKIYVKTVWSKHYIGEILTHEIDHLPLSH